MVKIRFLWQTFNDSMLPSILDESLFQPNPSEKHTQPILKGDVDVPQEAIDFKG